MIWTGIVQGVNDNDKDTIVNDNTNNNTIDPEGSEEIYNTVLRMRDKN